MIFEILVEQVNVSDDQYKLVELNCNSGKEISKGEHLLSYESSKAVFEYEAIENGYLYLNPELEVDEFYDVGFKIGVISSEEIEESKISEIFNSSVEEQANKTSQNITKKALKLINENNVDISALGDSAFITEKHVLEYLKNKTPKKNSFKADKEFETKLSELIETLDYGRKKMRFEFNRHVPTGNILNDRWKLAETFDWGKGSSVYDDCLIFGDVNIGENCWIGPFSILDGNAFPIDIGDWTSIGSGTHIYTHHTIDQALSGGKNEPAKAGVKIGKNCFISPQVMIAPGTKIGSSCFITAQSYVEGSFPDYSIVSGNPGKVVGKIEFDGAKVNKVFFS